MANAIVQEAWKLGIREFDTAQGYGRSESVLGKCLSDLGIAQEAKVMSKFDPTLNHTDVDEMSRSLDQSLSRLGVNSLFGMMLHKEDFLSLWEQGLRKTLEGFVSSGMIRHVGVSVYSPDQAIRALNTPGIDVVQLPTNILDRRFENAGVFELAEKMRKQIYIRSVFLQGLLLMHPEEIPPHLAGARPIVEKVDSLCNSLGLTCLEISLAYIRKQVPGARVVFGAEMPSQVTQSALAWEKNVPESLGEQIKALFPDVDERILNPTLWPEEGISDQEQSGYIRQL